MYKDTGHRPMHDVLRAELHFTSINPTPHREPTHASHWRLYNNSTTTGMLNVEG